MEIYITKDGEKIGPYSIYQARELVAAGTVTPNDWAWYDGLPDWVPLKQLPGFVPPGAIPVPAPAIDTTAYLPGPVTPVFTPRGQKPRPKKKPAVNNVGRRPLAVWFLCLIFVPISLLGTIAFGLAIPYGVPFAHGVMHGVIESTDKKAAAATDDTVREHWQHTAENLRFIDSHLEVFPLFSNTYLVTGVVYSGLMLASCIALFLMREAALPLFITGTLIGGAFQAWFLCNSSPAPIPPVLASLHYPHLVVIAPGWLFSFVILSYLWRLANHDKLI